MSLTMNERQSTFLQRARQVAKDMQDLFGEVYELQEQFAEEFNTAQDNAFELLEADTTIDTDSNAGQTTLSVADSSGFIKDQAIIINKGGPRQESRVVDSVATGEIDLSNNLTYTHTALDADEVITNGPLRQVGLDPVVIKTASQQGFANFLNFWDGSAVITREYGKDIRRIAK